MGRNKALPPSISLPVMGAKAVINTASLGGCLRSLKTRARWVERVPQRTQWSHVQPGEGRALSGFTLPSSHHDITANNQTTLNQSPPGLTRSVPSTMHRDRCVKHATGAPSKIRGRDNITLAPWNTRTLRAAGKLQEQTHEMDRHRWNILGLL